MTRPDPAAALSTAGDVDRRCGAVVQVPAPRPGVDGFRIGNPDRLVTMPNPQARVVSQAAVEEYLRFLGLGPADLDAYLAAHGWQEGRS
jgi:hypothetical protein